MHTSTWVEISNAALNDNIATYARIVAPAKLALMLKSNAYGHGIELIAQLANSNPHVAYFGLVSLTEALLLRSKGIQKPLFVHGFIDEDIELAITHDIAITVYDQATADALNQAAQRQNKQAQVHLKIDTGMSRLGLAPAKALELAQYIVTLPHIQFMGLLSHYAHADGPDQTYTQRQSQQLADLQAQLATHGITTPLVHASNSAGATAAHSSAHTLVRLGLGVYGLWPSPDNQAQARTRTPTITLHPVLTWKTRIIQIKEVPAGTYVGYGCTHKTTQPTRIATLPIGYWDGYDRGLSNCGQVLVGGTLAPVIGRISMNLTTIDITGIDASVGCHVTLLGDYTGIRAEDLAQHCGTINYEIITRINPLIPRVLTP